MCSNQSRSGQEIDRDLNGRLILTDGRWQPFRGSNPSLKKQRSVGQRSPWYEGEYSKYLVKQKQQHNKNRDKITNSHGRVVQEMQAEHNYEREMVAVVVGGGGGVIRFLCPVKLLAPRVIDISGLVTVLPVIKTFIVKTN